MTTAEAIRLVGAARDDEELFGVDAPERRYRELVAALHPDRLSLAGPGLQAEATAAFVEVTTRWRSRHVTELNGYRCGRPAHCGDLADLYDVGDDRLLKLPRAANDNDLMLQEERALRRLAEHGDPRWLPYVPRLVDSFAHRDAATGAERRINVIATAPRLHSLIEVRRAYPDGLDARDVAWMWRRLLVALGLAHRAGLVHGAVLPPHVLIEPDAHGVVLVDWCFSTDTGGVVPALVPDYQDWYPPEVTDRHPAGPGTDIAMAVRCMAWLMGRHAPAELRAFVKGCQQPHLTARPHDAWQLLGELDEVLERLYGPRTFRPFTLNP
ncbi:serine/threonine protein kinase [Micromonospora fiedleri]|uniref:Serine/threonine protein kinase n=1 Tax=Micromonospora fiedleri TaxID=1157498 RepID=A0ABS1UKR0_9ACTN|nr:serine/threonine protein kinase [Micromonospora fiedleri]MBL6276926.1 serine/threonine protein kinase [Micromonospora fiedleri]